MKLPNLPLILRRQLGLLLIFLLAILCACSTQIGKPTVKNTNEATSYTPVTIDNCGIIFTYKEPPKRAITLNQPATEIMLALGLEKYMIGTAYVDNKIPSQYQEAYKKIPILSDKYPSREVLLTNEPDFIYGSFPGAFGSDANRGREDFLSLRINSYLSPEVRELCKPKVGVLENLYGEIRDIGRIFGVEEQAKKFIASLQQQIQETQRKLGKLETRKRVFWYADEDPPYTITKASLPNLILELAGGKNIFQLPGEDTYVKVNWENVINNNPDVIILSESTWSPVEAQRRLFETNPAYSRLQAVQQKQFIIINYSYSTSIVSIAEGVRTLASGLYPEKFKQ